MTTTGARSVHPRALGQGEHDYGLEIASDSTPLYHQWVASLCEPHLGNSVLEVGAGHGAVTKYLVDNRRVTAVDSSPACVAAMRERFGGRPNVTIIEGDAQALPLTDRFDSIVMIDVLEHIFDDSAMLSALSQRLTGGGRVIVYVPAFDAFYTGLDRKIGHFRRYTKARLTAVINEAGLRVVQQRYLNFLAIPPWMLSGWLARSQRAHRHSLDAWDQTGSRLGRAIESRIEMPFGLNLFCVAALRE